MIPRPPRPKAEPAGINLCVKVEPADFAKGGCALENALMREEWIVDAFAGMTAIDVLSTSGKVARFTPSTMAWAVMRKSDRGIEKHSSFIVPLTGGRLVYTMPPEWR